jgi:pimeloyl-ACP methyl ester carboxylesterase
MFARVASRKTSLARWSVRLAVAVVLLMVGSAVVSAQDNKAAPKIPTPESVDLATRDGVALRATFYPGTKGNNTVPVVLLHMFKGSRKDYEKLAVYLQSQGHAVLVPDLRGHGDSTKVQGMARPLEADTMPRAAFLGMAEGDMEACKKFLVEQNNQGKLNIEKLCLVGAEMGAVVAADYAQLDWSWPVLATGKQGQDVKALVLISPVWSFRGLQLKQAMADPNVRGGLSVLIVVGKEKSRDAADANRLYSTFKRYHPDADAEKVADRSLFFIGLETSLQGTKILDENLRLNEMIAQFIQVRLVEQSFPWKERGKKK